jgi:Acetyltransferase (GNAT) domain
MDDITLHHDFSGIDPDEWDRCFEGEAEAGRYYVTAHSAAETGPQAITIQRAGRMIAVAPLFTLSYRLDTSLQGPLRQLTNRIAQWNDRLLRLDLVGFGSALAERCHIGFDPVLDDDEKRALFARMLAAVRDYASQHKIGLVVVKDLALHEKPLLSPVLRDSGFAEVASLPVAVLDLPATEEAWFAALSSSTRKDIKRKLKGGARVKIERVQMISEELAKEIATLYEETRSQSAFDYDDLETLPDDYFYKVSQALGEKAQFMLYRVDGVLAAFNLLFVEQHRVIDKFLGMRYPLARAHDLYAISWVTNLRYALDVGARMLQTGQTAYAAKLRYGSRLEPSFIYFRHRFFPVTWVLRMIAPLLAFDRNDPDLRAHRAREQEKSQTAMQKTGTGN